MVLLRFVAVYSIFDMMNVIFAAGLKGAGDTRYPLGATVVLSWVRDAGARLRAVRPVGFGVYVAWSHGQRVRGLPGPADAPALPAGALEGAARHRAPRPRPRHLAEGRGGVTTAGLALKAFLTLFVVMDPVGLAPVFLALAGTRSAPSQQRIARKAILVAAGIWRPSESAERALLRVLDISMNAFRVAGGILLFLIAVDMVLAQHERETKAEEEEARSRPDISVFPLAIPMIAGPGTLASLMILVTEAQAFPFGLALVLGMAAIVLLPGLRGPPPCDAARTTARDGRASTS